MKNLITIMLTFLIFNCLYGQVAVNTDGSSANASAMLDVKSTEKGILIPRMTSTQRDAISSPTQGLLVFVSSDSTYYFYQGSSWRKLGVGASGWDWGGTEIFADSLQSISIGDTAGNATFQVITDKATGNYTADKCTSGTASASENYAGKPASNAFDNSTSSYWSNDNNLSAWLQYDFGNGNGKVIEQYRIYFEAASYDASPSSWTFQASDNAISWITLDTKTAENWSGNEWKEYSFSNSARYRYYRINISDNKGTTNNYVSINEMEMQEMIYENHPTLVVVDNRVGIGTSTPSATLEVNGRISQTGLYSSVIIGESAGKNMTIGVGNCFIGNSAGYSNTTGYSNNALGATAFQWNSTGNYNNAIGHGALEYNTTGNDNNALGTSALHRNTTGTRNVAIGDISLCSNEIGFSNVAVGVAALYSSISISNLVAIGDSALYNNGVGATSDEGKWNTAIGSKAMYTNTKGIANTAIGFNSLLKNTTGINNTANGSVTLFSNTTGNNNTANGVVALYSNTTGNYNTASGSAVLRYNTTGNCNTAVGCDALHSNLTGNYNTANGYYALHSNTTGINNTANGVLALCSNTTGNYNTTIGDSSLYTNQTGFENCAFGTRVLRNNTGSYNVAMGTRASYLNTSGEANVGIGPNSLYHNTTGNNNVAMGSWAGPASGSTGLSNTTALGNYASITASNTIHIGNSSVTEIAGQVAWSTYSDKRFKKNINKNVPGLDFILKLNPVTYNWDINKLNSFLGVNEDSPESEKSANEQEQHIYTGFLAQEVEQIAYEMGYNFSGVVHPQNENSIYSIRYAEFVVPLVKAVQEQQEMIEKQNEIINILMEKIDSMESSK